MRNSLLILTLFRSEIVQLSCAVAFCGCMETSEEGFLVRDFFKHLSAADINYYFMSTACLPDLFARDSVNLEESDTSKYAGLANEKKAGHSLRCCQT